MTKWLEQNKKIVLILVLILFIVLALLYTFLIRPLAAREEDLRQELVRVQEDTSFYQQKLQQLKPQTFTDAEKLLLVGSVPNKPNVEEMIKDLEKTELETGVAIENMTISINPNGSEDEAAQQNTQVAAETQGNQAAEENSEQATQSPPEQGPSTWENILSKETLEVLKDAQVHLDDLRVSYVEMVINFNGEASDVHTFVGLLENLQRIIHIQNYDYSINEEKDNRLEGTLTIRAFYSEDFAKFIQGDSEFELDYQFDPSKLKRYKEPVSPTIPPNVSDTENNQDQEQPNQGNATEIEEEPQVPSDPQEPQEEKDVAANPDIERYHAPETKYGGSVFHVVQAGAYSSTKYMNTALQELINAGVYPRVIEDELSYIYVATDRKDDQQTSPQRIVDMLKGKGFDAYVKTVPYRLTEYEEETLLREAEDVVSVMNELVTKGITAKETVITEEQLKTVHLKVAAYEKKVQQVLSKSDREGRKQELQETLTILREIEKELKENAEGRELDSLWKVEGLILDYMLVLNGYVPAE